MLKVISSTAAEAPKMDENKAKALQAALSQIEKQFGKGSIMKMGDAEVEKGIQVVSTGSLGLDMALGVGRACRAAAWSRSTARNPRARPRSRSRSSPTSRSSAASRPSSTPSTRSTRSTPSASAWTRRELLISQPDNGEQALEIADMLVRSASVDCVVIDSVAALTPKAEIEGEMGEPQMGLQARLMSQALRKLTANIKRSNTLVIFINQIRMKIGVMFGNPETTTGGNALKFYASVRIDIRRIGSIKKGEEVDRQRDAREGGEEQGRAAVQGRRVRHPLQRGHLARGRDHRARRAPPASSRSPVPGTPTRARRSARARTTRASSSRTIPTSPQEIEAKIREAVGIAGGMPRRRGSRRSGLSARQASRRGRRMARANLTVKTEPSLRARAMRLLARREHSRAGAHAQAAPHVAGRRRPRGVLDDLAKRGWLSDARFAEQSVAREGAALRPLSASRTAARTNAAWPTKRSPRRFRIGGRGRRRRSRIGLAQPLPRVALPTNATRAPGALPARARLPARRDPALPPGSLIARFEVPVEGRDGERSCLQGHAAAIADRALMPLGRRSRKRRVARSASTGTSSELWGGLRWAAGKPHLPQPAC